MDIKFFKFGLLITATQIFFTSSCNKKGTTPCTSGGYSFAVTSEWLPQHDSYHIGDTLFLTSSFPKLLTDQINTSLVIDYSNSVGIQGDIGFASPDSIIRMNNPAKDSFQFISYIGSFSERPINQNQGINFNYAELSSTYKFRGAIVFLQRGLYAISVDNLISRGLGGKDCTNANFTMTVTNSEKNIVPYQSALNIILDAESLNKIFCARVE